MRRTKKKRAWGAQERLRYLDRLVFWRGEVRRSDLIKRFGISVQMASADIKTYRHANPKALRYDSKEKKYVSTERMRPLYGSGGIAQAMELLGERSADVGPWADRVSQPQRPINQAAIQPVFRAVSQGLSVEIRYASLHSATFRWRRITPHAFAFDGFRWHVRAFCHADRVFKDFVLGRIAASREPGPAEAAAKDDREWVSVVSVSLRPAEGLSAEEVSALELDFGLKDGVLNVAVREALVPYVLAQLGLDPYGHRIAPRFHLLRTRQQTVSSQPVDHRKR